MVKSTDKLRIYSQAVELEDQVYELTKQLPQEQYYPAGNQLRRASAAVAHHIHQTHERYSYAAKLAELDQVRRSTEQTQQLLEGLRISTAKELVEGYAAIMKQSWGLTKYLRGRLAERRVMATQLQGADELTSAQAIA